MKNRQWGLFAVGLAIVVVGLAWAGLPASTLLAAALFLACPLMMMVMMRGMHGGAGNSPADHQNHDTNDHANQHVNGH